MRLALIDLDTNALITTEVDIKIQAKKQNCSLLKNLNK